MIYRRLQNLSLPSVEPAINLTCLSFANDMSEELYKNCYSASLYSAV